MDPDSGVMGRASAQPSTARLRKIWQRAWLPDDGVSMVGAYAEGIHRISNPGSRPAISVHLYGPRMGMFDGRDYDPRRDFVCVRHEGDDVMASALQVAF